MLYVKVSASRSRWGPSPGSSGHTAYHEKDHLLDVSRIQNRHHQSSDQGEVALGVLEAKFRMIFIARGKSPSPRVSIVTAELIVPCC